MSGARLRTPEDPQQGVRKKEHETVPFLQTSVEQDGINNSHHNVVKIDQMEKTKDPRSTRGDRGSIALLMFLYVLQGIPLGIAASIPYLLQTRKISYKDQAAFSFVHWPFSLKLLWAPIVDSVYWSWFGRRKSWLIPTQYLIGFFMILLSGSIQGLMGEGGGGGGGETEGKPINILLLTSVFFMLNFLAATQDIAVDGWALTMLSKRNVGWVSTCNTVGQTTGFFLGNVVFLALESADFCNKYLRTEPQSTGVVTLADFLLFWGVVFFVSTTLVMVLKSELDTAGNNDSQGVLDAYHQLWKIVQLPSILSLIFILLTMKIGFAAADAVTGLKLIEEGVPKEHLAMMAVPMVPVDIVLPIIITRYMSSQRPLDVLLKSMPFRLLIGLMFAVLVWWAPSTKSAVGTYPFYFYAIILISSALHQVAVYCMYVPVMAFFAKVSDPVIGGTYMTLLNTVSNLGGNWPATVSLWLVDGLTWKGCSAANGLCSANVQDCLEPQKACTIFDGYYIESVACFFIGLAWLKLRARKVRELQDLTPEHWTCQ